MRRHLSATSIAAIFVIGSAGCHSRDATPSSAATTTVPAAVGTFDGAKPGESKHVAGIAFRWCPAGTFVMGSPPTEHGHRLDEAQVDVTISRGFWMAENETTQADWSRVMGAFPATQPADQDGAFPVVWVSHDDATRFCAALTVSARRTGQIPASHRFTLPTEAQWEYACRAGTTTAFAFGDRLEAHHANFASPIEGATQPTRRATPIGRFPANAWGLRDMHGNNFEYCLDWYHGKLPGGVDPDLSSVKGAPNRDGSFSRVRRGGAWVESETFCRSALRLRYEPNRGSDHIGFRVVVVSDVNN